MNIVELVSTILCCGFILLIALKLAKKQPESRNNWKLILTVLIGFFSLSFTFPFQGMTVKIAILPLGVWILFIMLRKREGNWVKYRNFAWLGFLSNYLFLSVSFLVMPIHQWIYPLEDLSTYIGESSDIEIENIHPSAKQYRQVIDNLQQTLTEFESETLYVEEWYYETYFNDNLTNVERFPYVIVGQVPKWGSNIKASVYIERDGKGLLVSTMKTHYYFRSEHFILKEGNDDE